MPRMSVNTSGNAHTLDKLIFFVLFLRFGAEYMGIFEELFGNSEASGLPSL